MKNRKVFLSASLAILLLSFWACESEKASVEAGDLVTISIPEDVQTGSHNELADLITSVDIIPLETTDSSLLQESDKLVMAEYIYHLNRRSKSFHIFDREGKFIKALPRGNGPGEVHQVLDFQIDESGDVLVLEYQNLKRYSAGGDFIENIKMLPDSSLDLGIMRFAWLGENHFYFWQNGGLELEKRQQEVYYHLYHMKDGQLLGSNMEAFSWTMGTDRFLYNHDHYLVAPTLYDNSVYEIGKEGKLRPKYEIDFGKFNVDRSQLSYGFSREIRGENFQKLTKVAMGVSKVYELGNYLYFQFVSNSQFRFVLYNLEDGAIHSSSMNDALIDDQLPFRIIGIDYKEQKLLAEVQPPYLLAYLKAANKELKESPLLNAADIALLKGIEATDNPVLLRLSID